VRLSILGPSDPLPADVNDCSIICRLSYGNFSVMLPGDAGVEAEQRVVRRKTAPVKSTILKVGHHGSSTSTSPPFLRAVSPEVAVISCKERDSHGWAPKAMQPIKVRAIKIYRTDHDGTVIVESDGKGYTVKTLGEGLDEAPPSK
jgi:competence protein ComEC